MGIALIPLSNSQLTSAHGRIFANNKYMKQLKALQTQCDGNHYVKNFKIQPVVFCQINGLGFCESSIIKYICRWNKKGQPEEDLKKIIHFAQILLELHKDKKI